MIRRIKHRRCIVRLRRETLRSVLKQFVGQSERTRKSISEACGISEVTVGKVGAALVASGLMTRTVRKPKDDGRVCSHYSPSRDICVLITDISTRKFRASICSPDGSSLFSLSYSYSDSFRFEENLMIFLNQVTNDLRDRDVDVSVSVLIAEDESNISVGSPAGFMPVKYRGLSEVKDMISGLVGFPPDIVISPSVAIKHAITSKHGGEVAYILLEDIISAYYISAEGQVSILKPQNMIIDGQPLSKYLGDMSNHRRLCTSLAAISNILDVSFSPRLIIAESSRIAMGKELVADTHEYLCGIYPSYSSIITGGTPTLAREGACIAAFNLLVKKLIVSFEDAK